MKIGRKSGQQKKRPKVSQKSAKNTAKISQKLQK